MVKKLVSTTDKSQYLYFAASCLKCPECGSSKIEVYKSKNQHSTKDRLICASCSFEIEGQDGFFDFTKPSSFSNNEMENDETYSRYWEESTENYDSGNYANELLIAQEYAKFVSGKTVCDLACGDGRLIKKWHEMGAKSLIFIDISDGIYLAKKRYESLKSTVPAIFIKASIYELPLKDRATDFTWFSGTLTLLEDQKLAMNETCRITSGMIVFGITSNNFLGRVYSALNLVRPLFRFLSSKNFTSPIFYFFALLIKYYCIVCTKINLPAFPFPKTTTEKLAQPNENVSHISKVISEPFLAPKVFRKNDTYYEEHLHVNGFSFEESQSDMLMDYYSSKPKISSSK